MSHTVVIFSGAYDLSCKEQLHSEFALLNFEPGLVLDLSHVTYVDSSFISELLTLHQRREANGFTTETIVMRPPILRLFDILDLNTTFRIVSTLDEAVGGNADSISSERAFVGTADLESKSPSQADIE